MPLNTALEMLADVATVKRPYDRRDFAGLDESWRERVRHAELGLCVAVAVSPGFMSGREAKGPMLDSPELPDPGDKALIDRPLQRMRELAQVYAESGLASDVATANRMADAFRDSVARFRREWANGRGGRR